MFAALPATNTSALPGTPNSFANNFTNFPRGTIQDDKGDARVDHTFNAKLSVFGVYSEHQETIFDPPPFGGPAGGNANTNVHIYNRQIAFGTTYVITPTSLLDFRMGIGTNQGAKAPYGVGTPGLLAAAGITDGLPTSPLIVRSLNAQAVTGFTQFGTQPASPQFQNPSVINPKANYTLVHGIHSIKVGYEYQAINTQINDYNPSFGQSNYGGAYSTTAGTPTDTGTGNNASAQISQARDLADFIFGNQNSYSLTNFFIASVRQRMNFMYVQDDIKLRPNLTLNAGLRYELATPQYEANNKLANFNPATNTLDPGEQRIHLQPRSCQHAAEQYRSSLWFRLQLHAQYCDSLRLRHQLYAIQPRGRREQPDLQRAECRQCNRQQSNTDRHQIFASTTHKVS